MERAAAFYDQLMDWTFVDVPGTRHRFIQSQGKTVASIQQIDEGQNAWVPHVAVKDAERTASDAVSLGAALIDFVDVAGVARTATLRDSEDTLFGLWQPAPHQGAELTDGVGSLWWIEVLSNKPADAREFYTRLFGWTATDTAFEPFALYIFFKHGETHESGILPIGKNWGVPPRWNSIFSVENCDATIARALQLGAKSHFVHTVPKTGRIGNFNDPDGAVFLVRGPV
jgi:predicted enzyme related to lactoylglutathione lyase